MRTTKVFLRDENVFNKIIDAAELSDKDIVLEIGSGDGRLTKRVAGLVKKVYAMELDIHLLDASKVFLRDFKNIEFICGDALELEFPKDCNKIISNLPYAISSPITTRIIEFLNDRKDSFAVLMYQREFGDRMLASPGFSDYSMLSVFAQYTSEVELVTNVSKNAFRPRPAVDSVVLKIRPKNDRIDDSFLAFCRLLFQHKKKNLYSSLMASRGKLTVASKDELREKLKGIDEETLKKKVFYFEISELLSIYKKMSNLSVCLKEK